MSSKIVEWLVGARDGKLLAKEIQNKEAKAIFVFLQIYFFDNMKVAAKY